MTITFRAHFDGRVIVPDEPVDLPVGRPLVIWVREVAPPANRPLAKLAELASEFPENPDAPPNGAAEQCQHRRGTSKRS